MMLTQGAEVAPKSRPETGKNPLGELKEKADQAAGNVKKVPPPPRRAAAPQQTYFKIHTVHRCSCSNLLRFRCIACHSQSFEGQSAIHRHATCAWPSCRWVRILQMPPRAAASTPSPSPLTCTACSSRSASTSPASPGCDALDSLVKPRHLTRKSCPHFTSWPCGMLCALDMLGARSLADIASPHAGG